MGVYLMVDVRLCSTYFIYYQNSYTCGLTELNNGVLQTDCSACTCRDSEDNTHAI